MKQDKKLILGMALLFLITFVSFGTIVVTEKLAPFFTDKIKTKFETYIEKNYKDDKNNLTIGKITYKNQQYKAKISNKKIIHKIKIFFFIKKPSFQKFLLKCMKINKKYEIIQAQSIIAQI